jgi:hypothetical protein
MCINKKDSTPRIDIDFPLSTPRTPFGADRDLPPHPIAVVSFPRIDFPGVNMKVRAPPAAV